MEGRRKVKEPMIMMAVETSCDETSVAIVKNGREVLTNIIYSQIDIHKKFGGVVPEVASRNHLEKISQVVDQALEEAKMTFEDIDCFGVTYGPGLVGALLIGVAYVKALAYALNKPFVPVNHIEGHICANFIAHPELEPPFMGLIVSGGHSHLVLVKDYGVYEILGRTRDDAVGEAFDKVARTLGLGYPGGPLIDKLAQTGNPEAIHFTRTYLEKGSFDFSFSGIKSGVLNYINNQKQKGATICEADLAASFQEAVVEVLVTKAVNAAKVHQMNRIVMAGGVASNTRLRQSLKEACDQAEMDLYYPPVVLCTDNAAMIGCAAYYAYKMGVRGDEYVNAVPNLKLGQQYELKTFEK